MHDDVRCSCYKRIKSKTMCFHDKTEDGVDINNLVIRNKPLIIRLQRWTMKTFVYMLRTAHKNALTVFK